VDEPNQKSCLLGRFVFVPKAEALKTLIEVQIVTRAGDLSKFPSRSVFVIEVVLQGFARAFGSVIVISTCK